MCNDLISLFRLHFICWYFLMTEGTITLSQISSLSAHLGIIKWRIQMEYKQRIEAVLLIRQNFLPSILEELEIGKKPMPTEVIHRLGKVCLLSRPRQFLSHLCLVHSWGHLWFYSSNSNDLIILSFSSIFFKNSLTSASRLSLSLLDNELLSFPYFFTPPPDFFPPFPPHQK